MAWRAVALVACLVGHALAACSSMRMAAELSHMTGMTAVSIGEEGTVTSVPDGPMTPEEKASMDSVSNDRLITGPLLTFSDDLSEADKMNIADALARILQFADQTCHCHKSPHASNLDTDEKSEMKCSCSKGGSTKALIDGLAMAGHTSADEASDRMNWCSSNPGTCPAEEVAALEAVVEHNEKMAEIAKVQVAEVARLQEKCNELISSNSASHTIQKCLTKVSSMKETLTKFGADTTDASAGSTCSNRISPEKRYKLLIAQERLHNATVRLKREQDERYTLVKESVAKSMEKANAKYKPVVTQADINKAKQQLEGAQQSLNAAQAYYKIMQDNFAGFLQEKTAETQPTIKSVRLLK